MLALLAIATSSVALTGCGQIIHKRPDLRVPAVRLGAGIFALLLIALLAGSLSPGTAAETVALSTLIASGFLATGLAVRLWRRPAGMAGAVPDEHRRTGSSTTIDTDSQFCDLLADLARSAGARLGMEQVVIHLDSDAGVPPACTKVWYGVTNAERHVLERCPGLDLTSRDADGLFEPFVLSSSETLLSVATQTAWSSAGKLSALIIPLRAGNHRLGHVELWNRGADLPSTPDLIEPAAAVGADAGNSVDWGLTQLAARGEIIEAEMLLTVSEVFSRGSSLGECLPEVARQLLQRAESDRITITLIDETAEEVWIAADARGSASPEIELEGKRFPLAIWVSYDEIVRQGGPLAISSRDPGPHPRIADLMALHGAQSYLAVPGYANGRISSIVQIMSRMGILAESAATQAIWVSIARQIQFGIDTMLTLESSKRRERLEAMRRQVNELLQAGGNLRDVYQAAAEMFRQVSEVDGAAILSVVPGQSGQFIVEAEWADAPIAASPAGSLRTVADCPYLADVHRGSHPIQRRIDHPGSTSGQNGCSSPGKVAAAIAMPLRVEDQFVGALMLYSSRPRVFPAETLELAEQLGGTLSLVVNTIRLRRRDEELREEQFVKLRMLAAATSREDPIEALKAVTEAGLGHAGAESIHIAFIDAISNTMVIGADCTIPEWPGVDDPGERWPIVPGSIQERSYLSQQPLRYSSADPDLGPAELADIEEYGVHAWITAPLRVGGKVVGLLQVLSRDPNAFDDGHVRFWDEIAQQIAPVITTLQVSFDNLRLSRQQRLVALINQAGATATTADEAYQRLARVGLELARVESSLLFLWHEEDGLLEVAHEAVVDESLRRYRPGQRIRPSNWDDNGPPIRPRPPVHLYATKPDLSSAEHGFLDRIDRGQTAIFMMLEEGQVHGVMALESSSGDPFPTETIEIGEVVASTAAAVLRNLRSRDLDRRKEREQDVVVRISRAATTSASVDDLLAALAESSRILVGARCAEIYWFNDDRTVKALVAADSDAGWTIANPVGTAWPTSAWPIDQALIESGDPLIVLETDDPRLDERTRQDLARSGIESLACIPLTGGEQTRGYIALFSDQPMHFTSELTRATASVASQGSLAIEHVKTRLEEIRVGEQRRLLLSVGQAASSSLDIDTALAEIASASLGVAASESCVIELFDPDSEELVLSGISRVSDWVIQEDLLGKRRHFGAWAIDGTLRDQGSVMIGSVEDARVRGLMRDDMLRYETNSILAHALLSGGVYIGAFYLFARATDAYQATDAWLVSEIAAHIVTAVQNAQILANEHQIAGERARLLEITEAATRTLDPRKVLREIASATLGLANAECCHIELLNEGRQELVTEAYAATPEWPEITTWGVGTRADFGDWPIDQKAVESRTPIFIGSIEDPLVVGGLRDDMLRLGMQSILVIPLWVAESCVGLLNLYSRKRNAFTIAQQTIAHTLATNAANAIQNAQTHERERARRRDQEALLRLSAAATSSLDVHEAMNRVCVALRDVVDAESAVVGLYLPDQEAFEIVANVTTPDRDFATEPGAIFTVKEYPAYAGVVSSAQSQVVERGTAADYFATYFAETQEGLETLALIPLWLNDACLGYMGLFDRRPGQFDGPKLALLESAAPLIGLALSHGLTSREQQRRASDRERVVSVGRAAVSDVDVATKLRMIAEACLGLYRVDGVSIYEWDAVTSELILMVDASGSRSTFQREPGFRFAVPPASPFRPYLESSNASVFSSADPNLDQHLRHGMEQAQGHTSAIFPLWVDDKLIGLAAFYSFQPYAFDEESLRVGREVATQTALTIQASRLLDTTVRYANEQSALLAVNRAVLSVTQGSIQETLETISRETMILLGADCCEIEGLAPALNATVLLAQVVAPDWKTSPSGPGLELLLSDWPTTQHVLEQQQALVLDIETAALTRQELAGLSGFGTQSALIAPMVISGNSVGIITFYSRQRQAFTRDHARLATEFGSLAALAIDRVRTREALAEQATIDGLTGLLNHRALMERLDHQIAVADRTGDRVSLLMIDMDKFKAVNDTHGHLAGDAVLRETGRFFRHALRTADLVGRYGGDEFTAILPSTDIEQAIALRNRLMEMMPTNQIALADGSVVTPSYSIGVAAYPTVAADRQALISAADRSMYEAKHGGVGSTLERSAVTGTEPARLTG
jgi:diguanylate cyclase (GGDEF)-like protein